ncbi:MAG: hypothetical protein HQK76_16290 [Desulfobacterales bacterium]|nr:hypothetical protein [Desulfobacterales bacterium]
MMYFSQPGKINTEQVLKLAFEKARQTGINEIVIATTTGATVYSALEIFQGFKIAAVTYHCGFKEPFKKVMPDEV